MIRNIARVLGLRKESTGERGECLAGRFLSWKKRYAIVARNWRNPKDRREELDLVCKDGEILVFVEVKTRDSLSAVRGYDAVNARKRKVMRRAALAYLFALAPSRRPKAVRFDVVEVSQPAGGGEPQILHFENISVLGRHFLP
ncbi:MAG: YraN family protein [Opitutaceae bacterium]